MAQGKGVEERLDDELVPEPRKACASDSLPQTREMLL